MGRRPAPKELNISNLFGDLSAKIKQQAVAPNIIGYKPHAKQTIFHQSDAFLRLYIGGNRSGKTFGGGAEAVYWMKGEHPYLDIPEAPTRGRIVCVDFNQGIQQIIIPKLKQLIPPSLLKNGSWDDSFDAQAKMLTLTNGSTVALMTYEQKTEAFAGTSLHWTWYDEEPPQHIYNENQLRLLDTNGKAWITMTPLEGMTWIYEDIFEPGLAGDDPDVFVLQIDIHENPYLNPDAIKRVLSNVKDDDERAARESGKFIQLGGLVYKGFNKDFHVVPPIDPRELHGCQWYSSMDHGFNAPSAWLWHAVFPNGHVITFAEHYKNELVVSQHAQVVKAMEQEFGKIPDIRIADPATAQRQGVTGSSIQTEYALNGIYLSSGNNDVLSGVNQVSSYLRGDSATGKPRWLITENCENLIREIQRLRWKTHSSKKAQFNSNPQEQIHKKNDHACDAARYFFNFMPKLDFETMGEPGVVTPRSTALQRYDELLAKGTARQKTEWTVETDTNLEWEIDYV